MDSTVPRAPLEEWRTTPVLCIQTLHLITGDLEEKKKPKAVMHTYTHTHYLHLALCHCCICLYCFTLSTFIYGALRCLCYCCLVFVIVIVNCFLDYQEGFGEDTVLSITTHHGGHYDFGHLFNTNTTCMLYCYAFINFRKHYLRMINKSTKMIISTMIVSHWPFSLAFFVKYSNLLSPLDKFF